MKKTRNVRCACGQGFIGFGDLGSKTICEECDREWENFSTIKQIKNNESFFK